MSEQETAWRNTQHVVQMKHKGNIVIDENYRFESKSAVVRFFKAILYYVVAALLWVYNKGYLGLKVRGKCNLRAAKKLAGGGYITVSNHIHVMDCSMTSSVCLPRKTAFTSLAGNLTIPVAGALVKALGGVPIPSEAGKMRYFVNYAAQRLKRGKPLHYYPEGVLRPYSDNIYDFNRGAFYQAAKCNVPIVPIVYTERKARGIFRLYRGRKCCFTAHVLSPVMPDLMDGIGEASRKMTEYVQKLMRDTFKQYSDKIVAIDYTAKTVDAELEQCGAVGEISV